MIDVAIDTGYLPQGFRYLDQEEFRHLSRSDIVCLCTGSQGEPRAALARIAADEHPDVELGKGDLVIFSSRTIPGNERAVAQVQNRLVALLPDAAVERRDRGLVYAQLECPRAAAADLAAYLAMEPAAHDREDIAERLMQLQRAAATLN